MSQYIGVGASEFGKLSAEECEADPKFCAEVLRQQPDLVEVPPGSIKPVSFKDPNIKKNFMIVGAAVIIGTLLLTRK